jgi:hypothetical protein
LSWNGCCDDEQAVLLKVQTYFNQVPPLIDNADCDPSIFMFLLDRIQTIGRIVAFLETYGQRFDIYCDLVSQMCTIFDIISVSFNYTSLSKLTVLEILKEIQIILLKEAEIWEKVPKSKTRETIKSAQTIMNKLSDVFETSVFNFVCFMFILKSFDSSCSLVKAIRYRKTSDQDVKIRTKRKRIKFGYLLRLLISTMGHVLDETRESHPGNDWQSIDKLLEKLYVNTFPVVMDDMGESKLE